jgi:hypothetical protein
MPEYSIFAPTYQAGFLAANDAGATSGINLGMPFTVVAVTGWRCLGARVFVPGGTPPAANGPQGAWSAHLFTTTPGAGGKPQPAALVRSANFASTPLRDQWNEVRFGVPYILAADTAYWITVFFSDGTYGSLGAGTLATEHVAPGSASLKSLAHAAVLPGAGVYLYGTRAGLPFEGGTDRWYGADVIVDDGIGGGADASIGLSETLALSETVTGGRSGLPGTITATGSARDPLGLTATTSRAVTIGGATGVSTVRRSLIGTRIVWGSVIDQGGVLGPTPAQEPTAVTPGVLFQVQWDVRVTGGRFYKAPLLAGTVAVVLWAPDGSKLAETSVTVTADGGGWQRFTFPTPATVSPCATYAMSYFSPAGHFVHSPWVWHAQDWVNPPFHVPMFRENSQGRFDGSAYGTGATHTMPVSHTASNYYIDPEVEWSDPTPRYSSGLTYFDQWVEGGSPHAFPVGVFFADPPFLADYMSIGVNTLIGGGMSDEYAAAVKASGMEWWPTLDFETVAVSTITQVLEDAPLGALVRGYFLGDEPDMVIFGGGSWRGPQFFQDLRAVVRQIDATRPVMLNLGKWPPYNMGFAWQPQGATPLQVNDYWRGYTDKTDVLSIDWYNMTSDQAFGLFGIWTYPEITRKAFELSDGRVPVWGYVETTAQVPGEPAPSQVYRASWAHLIAGARGIVFFDHRFAGPAVTQDFAALLHDPPMRARVQALASQLTGLAPALHAAEANLVTGSSSSGVMVAALGGMAAGAKVPVHYATRVVGATEYLFAQTIRPGTTTASFTAPTASNKTVTVLGESRTLTANSAGTFNDTFNGNDVAGTTGDYTVHLYSWDHGTPPTDPPPSGTSFTYDPAFVGPDYYDRWSKGPSSDPTYFPILAYHMNLTQWSGLAARVTGCNVNGILMAYDQSADYIMQAAIDAGLDILGIASLAQWHELPANNIDTVYPTQNGVITAYAMSDEPNQGDSVYEKYGDGTPALDTGAQTYVADSNAQKAADPTRPILGNFTKDVMEWNNGGPAGWTEAEVEQHNRTQLNSLDIASGDVYGWADEYEWHQDDPTFGTGHVAAWVYGHTIDRLRYYNPNVPAFGFVEGCRSGDGVNTIMPGMIKAAVWNLLVHGARGYTIWPRDFYGTGIVLYPGADEFIGEFNMFADHQWDTQYTAFQQVNAEVKALAPQLNAPTVLGCSATGTGGVPVTTLGKDDGGKLWLLVQADGNTSHPLSNQASMTATITVPTVIAAGTVFNVVGESRTVTVSAGHTFTDTFGTTTETPPATVRTIPPLTYGYAHHIYREA